MEYMTPVARKKIREDKNNRPVDQREIVSLLIQVDLAVVVDEELDGQKSAGKDNRKDFIPAHRSQPGA